MHFLEPVATDGYTVEQLKEKVFAIMKDHYTSVMSKVRSEKLKY
jgi:hypothetical protein